MTNNHKLRRVRCGCGCGTATLLFRLVPVADGNVICGVLPDHLKAFHSKLRKRDELREFLRNHSKGWFHRFWWSRSLFRLSRYAHGSKQAWLACVMFLSPRRLANRIARGRL